jgi:hypothetical protein
MDSIIFHRVFRADDASAGSLQSSILAESGRIFEQARDGLELPPWRRFLTCRVGTRADAWSSLDKSVEAAD